MLPEEANCQTTTVGVNAAPRVPTNSENRQRLSRITGTNPGQVDRVANYGTGSAPQPVRAAHGVTVLSGTLTRADEPPGPVI